MQDYVWHAEASDRLLDHRGGASGLRNIGAQCERVAARASSATRRALIGSRTRSSFAQGKFCSGSATNSCIIEPCCRLQKTKNMNEKVNKLHWHSIGIRGDVRGAGTTVTSLQTGMNGKL